MLKNQNSIVIENMASGILTAADDGCEDIDTLDLLLTVLLVL